MGKLMFLAAGVLLMALALTAYARSPGDGITVVSRAARRCTTAAEESGYTGTMRKD